MAEIKNHILGKVWSHTTYNDYIFYHKSHQLSCTYYQVCFGKKLPTPKCLEHLVHRILNVFTKSQCWPKTRSLEYFSFTSFLNSIEIAMSQWFSKPTIRRETVNDLKTRDGAAIVVCYWSPPSYAIVFLKDHCH